MEPLSQKQTIHPDLISHDVFQEELVLISDMKATLIRTIKTGTILMF